MTTLGTKVQELTTAEAEQMKALYTLFNITTTISILTTFKNVMQNVKDTKQEEEDWRNRYR